MFPDSQATIADDSFGLRCWQGSPQPMATAHRHDDVEVNVVTAGEISYLFGGSVVRIEQGRTAAFWATMPHQLVNAAPGSHSLWLTVPISLVLGWPLDARTRAALLSTRPVIGPASTDAALDEALFTQWVADLDAGAERADIALLEMQARLRRLVSAAPGPPADTATPAGSVPARDTAAARAAAMAAHIARHHAEPIGPAQVAAAVHLHPHHAMAVFRAVVGDTIGGYLARCRVAQAQRLLLTTSMPVSAVGHEVGFASTSRFYSTFTGIVGVPPGRYRRDGPTAPGP